MLQSGELRRAATRLRAQHPPSHEPERRTVAFRPLQRWTPESARKQPEGCGPRGFRFKTER
ncbi:MAG: hypothetical protein FJ398_26805 [Verrucomicrobia bacterium]|nr:hypothetical protein [Verrucomicrobiota bacterium]